MATSTWKSISAVQWVQCLVEALCVLPTSPNMEAATQAASGLRAFHLNPCYYPSRQLLRSALGHSLTCAHSNEPLRAALHCASTRLACVCD